MSKHTPGPWRVILWSVAETSGCEAVAEILACPPGDEEGTLVAGVYVAGPDEGEANASLIAAAPDLLAAVKLLLALPGISSFAANLDSAAVKQAEAAAHKAEGN